MLHFPQEKIEIKTLNDARPLSLSFIGDAVHTAYIRALLFKTEVYAKNGGLHLRASKLVCAKNQAEKALIMQEFLTEEELFIFKKAKNADTKNLPKNADLMEYHLATAFEAVIGFLYLAGCAERLEELLSKLYKRNEKS